MLAFGAEAQQPDRVVSVDLAPVALGGEHLVERLPASDHPAASRGASADLADGGGGVGLEHLDQVGQRLLVAPEPVGVGVADLLGDPGVVRADGACGEDLGADAEGDEVALGGVLGSVEAVPVVGELLGDGGVLVGEGERLGRHAVLEGVIFGFRGIFGSALGAAAVAAVDGAALRLGELLPDDFLPGARLRGARLRGDFRPGELPRDALHDGASIGSLGRRIGRSGAQRTHHNVIIEGSGRRALKIGRVPYFFLVAWCAVGGRGPARGAGRAPGASPAPRGTPRSAGWAPATRTFRPDRPESVIAPKSARAPGGQGGSARRTPPTDGDSGGASARSAIGTFHLGSESRSLFLDLWLSFVHIGCLRCSHHERWQAARTDAEQAPTRPHRLAPAGDRPRRARPSHRAIAMRI